MDAESWDERANDTRRELLAQCAAAEYAMRAHQMMSFFVPEYRGHDDPSAGSGQALLNAAALVTQAARLGRVRTAAGRRRGDPQNP